MRARSCGVRDAGELRYLDGGGGGCFNEDDRPTDRRKLYHHLTFYVFVLCFARTCLATLYHYCSRASALSVWDCRSCWVRSAHRPFDRARRLLAEKWKRDPDLVDETRLGMDVAFIHVVLTQFDGHGAIAARQTRRWGRIGAASRRGVRAVRHQAYGKFVHGFTGSCAGALCAGAADVGAYSPPQKNGETTP